MSAHPSFAVPDWWARLEAGQAPLPDVDLVNPELADAACRALGLLRLPDVVGQPRLSEAMGDWVFEFCELVFGTLDPETRVRGASESFVLVPKKNGKTTVGAALALVFLLLNPRRNAEALLTGPTQQIAEISFQQAKGMIDADPSGWLADRFGIDDHNLRIIDRHTDTVLQVKTFSQRVLTGIKPIFALVEEIHELGEKPRATEILGQIRGGMIAMPDAHLMMITTQSNGRPAGVFAAELRRARDIRDGKQEGSLVPMLYEFPDEIQADPARPWARPEIWGRVNPNLGRVIPRDKMVEQFEAAEREGEHELRRWATQHLNIETGVALRAGTWGAGKHWDAAAEPGLTLETLLERSEVVVAAIDAGGLDDLLSLAVLGRCRTTKNWLAWGHAWAHMSALERRKSNLDAYQDFARRGELTICERPTQDVEEIAAQVAALRATGLMPEKAAIGLDQFDIVAIVDALEAAGVPSECMTYVSQGVKLSAAIWGAERKLADGTLRHAALEIHRFAVENAVVEPKGNAVAITKEIAGRSKIDPLVALLMAVDLMSRSPEAAGQRRTPWDRDPNFRMTA